MRGTRDSGEHALRDGTVSGDWPAERTIPIRWGLVRHAHSRQRQTGRLPSSSRSRLTSIAWLALVPASAVTGVALTWAAARMSVEGQSYSDAIVVFLTGMLLIFAPAVARAVMRGTPRAERVADVVTVGLAMYLIKIAMSPQEFTWFDEYIWTVTTNNILSTGRIFGANPLLPTAGYYPGLGAVTAGLIQVTGLSLFPAGLIVIGVARLLICGLMFGIAERITRSHRAAAAAAMMYVANPLFVWDSYFSYENLALPLAFLAVWWVIRSRGRGRGVHAVTAVVIAAVVVTHHIAGVALAIVFAGWWAASLAVRRPARERWLAGVLAAATLAGFLVWLLLIARPAYAYLVGQNVAPGLAQLGAVVSGKAAARKLYSGGGGTAPPPEWWTLAGFASIGVIMVMLPPALWRAWQLLRQRDRPARAPLAAAAVAAACYPLTLLPRLTTLGGALSSRTSEYEFAALGIIVGVLSLPAAAGRARSRLSRAARTQWNGQVGTATISLLIVAVFAGGITIGRGYLALLPTPAGASSYPSSPQPDAWKAAEWARARLGRDRPFAATTTDAFALAIDGEDPVDGDTTFGMFFAPTLAAAAPLIRATGVQYVLVDWQMTTLPPAPGFGDYVSGYEPGSGIDEQPLPAADLAKFTGPCARVLARFGSISVVDVAGIEDGSCVPGQASGKGHADARHP